MAEIFSNVTTTFDETAYQQGQTMTLTLGGYAVVQEAAPAANLTVSLSDPATGATGSVVANVPQVINNVHNAVVMKDIVDSSGRLWLVADNGLTATATA